MPPSAAQLQILQDYAAGKLGTRDTIEALELEDFGDLMKTFHGSLLYQKPIPPPS